MARHEVESEVTGNVWKILLEVGADVAEGDVIMILESMKMESWRYSRGIPRPARTRSSRSKALPSTWRMKRWKP